MPGPGIILHMFLESDVILRRGEQYLPGPGIILLVIDPRFFSQMSSSVLLFTKDPDEMR